MHNMHIKSISIYKTLSAYQVIVMFVLWKEAINKNHFTVLSQKFWIDLEMDFSQYSKLFWKALNVPT